MSVAVGSGDGVEVWGEGVVVGGRSERPLHVRGQAVRLGGVVQRRHTWVETG